MLLELPVHHVSAEGVVLQMPDGQGFGRLTKKTLGDDRLAERMIKHFSGRDTLHVSSLRRRDPTGYVMLSLSMADVCSDVRLLEPQLSQKLQDLYRKNALCGIGSIAAARVVKRSPKGTIFALPNGMPAASVDLIAADVEAPMVRILDYDANTNVAAVATGDTVDRTPQDGGALSAALSGRAVGDFASCHVLLVVGDVAIVEVFGADVAKGTVGPVSVIGFALLQSESAKNIARGDFIDAQLSYVPSKALQGLTPFVMLTTRPFERIPMIREEAVAAKALRVVGKFPWRDGSGAGAEDGDGADAGDNDDDAKSRMRRRKLEEAIDAFERDKNKLPTSPEEFKKALLADPNSSFMWTRYMAHHVELEQIELARLVAEKALSTIGVREAQELLNVWVAYMNLENLHGTAESLTAVFRRAVANNDDQLIVHEKLADIFAATKKHQQLLALCRVMTSKFRTEPRVWERLGKVLIDGNKRDQLKRMLKDIAAAGALKKDEQAMIVTHLCIHEYKLGSVEAGRALFEGLVAKLPKKSDVWSAFIDQELALLSRKAPEASVATVRALFTRVTAIMHPPKVMQQFFTRFLNFEQAYGDATDVDKVKVAARKYVESRIAETSGAPTAAPSS